MHKVAIYIRVSTQEQAEEGYSIAAQTERLTAYCKAKDWTVAGIYTDGGFSGSNMERPELQRLFADIKTGLIDCVLVYKLDRLSRSQKDTLTIIEDILLKNNVSFVSMSENFDTSSPLGRAMIGILSVFAQLEREQIKERTALGRAERAKNGLWHGGGWRPYGYDYKDGRLYVNEYEAQIIKIVYDMFLNHIAITSIVNYIRPRYYDKFNQTLCRSILSTILYAGKIVWHGEVFDGQHEAIITEEQYNQAAVWMKSRARIAASKPNPFKSTSLFGSLLRCGNCGAGYFVKGNYSGRGVNRAYRSYYTCYSRGKTRRENIIDASCRNPSYAVVYLDNLLLGEIQKLIDNPSLVDKISLANSKNDAPDTVSFSRTAIMRKFDNIDNQLTRLLDLYQLGSIPLTDVSDRSKRLQEEKIMLQKTLSELNAPLPKNKLSVQEAKDILASFNGSFYNSGIENRQRILRTLIQNIIVKEDKDKFDIIWNF